VSIIQSLFLYFIEAAHAAGTLVGWSLIFSQSLGPMPFQVAQLALTLAWSAGDLMFILGTGISVSKILYLTHFDLIFGLDQDAVSRRVLGVSLFAGCIPNLVICIHQTASGRKGTVA
jgi:hypothetical protein